MVQALWQLPSWFSRVWVRPALALTTLSAACTVTPVDDSADAETGSSTHALITIERSTTANSLEAPRAAAFAGFVRTPPAVDANDMLRLAGFGLDLPAVGQCSELNRERDTGLRLSPLARVEFLDAGDVTLKTSSSNAVLATRALPAVTDAIAGVVYTTRDRAPEPLPAATAYTLSTSGAGALRAFNVNVAAPPTFTRVSVGALPLAQLANVSIRRPIELEWSPGQSTDLVYLELATQDGSRTTRCTFRDDAGAGTVPASVFVSTGTGEISLHRLHSEPFASAGGVDAGEVRFDFEQSANVEFSD